MKSSAHRLLNYLSSCFPVSPTFSALVHLCSAVAAFLELKHLRTLNVRGTLARGEVVRAMNTTRYVVQDEIMRRHDVDVYTGPLADESIYD